MTAEETEARELMELLGTIVRLQIQQESLKAGTRPHHYYDPAPLRAVPSLAIGATGATSWDQSGSVLLDAHHRDHPAGKFRGNNGISVLFTAHYDAMRDRFGSHLEDGIAGESILVETNRMIVAEDLRQGLVIETATGEQVHLHDLIAAEPCVEFTRYALRYPPDARATPETKTALQFLRGGMRGFYAICAGGPVTIRPGDSMYRA